MEGQECPAGQTAQAVAPPRETLPARHATGSAAGVGHSWPAGQAVQLDAAAAPNVWVPAPHAEQTPAPAAADHPAGQGTGAAAGSAQEWPAGHSVHVAAPGEGAKLPAGQAEQAAADVPLLEALAVPAGHASGDAQLPAHQDPGGHCAQVAPDAEEEHADAYVPAAHGQEQAPPEKAAPGVVQEHDVRPAALTAPSGHARQSAKASPVTVL